MLRKCRLIGLVLIGLSFIILLITHFQTAPNFYYSLISVGSIMVIMSFLIGRLQLRENLEEHESLLDPNDSTV